jgi:hypothetical protein
MRKLIFIILILSLSAAYFYSVRRQGPSTSEPKDLLEQTRDNIKKMFKNSTSAAVAASGDSQAVQSSPASGDVSLQSMSTEQLQNWVHNESKSMDSTTNNTEDVQIKLSSQARTLLPEQLQVIKNLALDIKEPANSRIFSAYFLTLSSAEGSTTQLYDVAQAAVPDYGPVLPHSEAELRHAQDLAIKYMQVDELYERAKTDTNARDKLKLLSTGASTEQVRHYAEKKLKELK